MSDFIGQGRRAESALGEGAAGTGVGRRQAKSGTCRQLRRSRRLFQETYGWESLEDRIVLSTITWNNHAASNGGSWDNPSNWINSVVPGPNDDAVISLSTGTVTLSSNAADSVHSLSTNAATTIAISNGSLTIGSSSTLYGGLTVSGGTLGGSSLVVKGPLAWSGGTITGASTLEASAGITLGNTSGSTASTMTLAGGRSLINDTTASGSGSTGGFTLAVSGGSTITNKASATFTFTNNSSITNGGGSPSGGTFINQGTLSSNGGTGTSSVGILLTNTGTVQAQTGTLSLGGGATFSGASVLTAASGANLGFSGGTVTIPAGLSITGAGGLVVNGATLSFLGTDALTGPLEVDSGEVDFSNPVSPSTLTVNGGTIGGNANITVNGATTWTGGTMKGSGTTEAKAGITFGYTTGGTVSTATLAGGRTLINDTTATVGGNNLLFTLNVSDGSKITNPTGATFAFNSAATIAANGGSPAGGSFVNQGTLTGSAGSSTANATIGIPVTNSGTVQALSGNLIFSGGITFASTSVVTASSGARLGFNGGAVTIPASLTVTGDGGLLVNGSTLSFLGTDALTGPIEVDAGEVDFSSAVTTSGLKLFGGTIGGTGAVTVNGTMSWLRGTMTGATTTEVTGLLSLGYTGGGAAVTTTLNGGRTLITDGGANVAGNGLPFTLSVGNNAKITNPSGATWTIKSDATIGGSSAGNFTNQGTISSAGTTANAIFNMPVVNSGAIKVTSGKLDFQKTLTLNSGGTINVGPAGVLGLHTGTYTFGTGTATPLTGTGGIDVAGATVTLDSSNTLAGAYEVDSGSLTLSTDTNVTSLTINGGTLTGSGAINVSGPTVWTNGTMTGSGTTDAQGGLTLGYKTGTTASTLTLGTGRSLMSDGAATIAGNGQSFVLNTSSTSTINNGPSSSVTILSDATLNGTGNFNVQGSLSLNGGTGTSTINMPVVYDGTDPLSVVTGTLKLAGGLSTMSGASVSSGTYVISGILQVPNASFTTNNVSITLNTPTAAIQDTSGNNAFAGFTTNASGATLNVIGGASVNIASLSNAGTVTIGTSSSIAAGGDIYNTGTINLGTSSSLTTPGALTNESSFTTGTSSSVSTTGPFTNDGTSATGANSTFSVASFTNTGTFTTGANSTLTTTGALSNSGTLTLGTSSSVQPGASSTNSSEIIFGTGSTLAVTGTYTQSGGQTLLNASTLQVSAQVRLNGGTLDGSGTVNGLLINGATVNPGGSGTIGTINVNGNYTQSSGGTLNTEIAGNTQFDQLAVSGAVTLDGTSSTTLLNGYIPGASTSFHVLTFSSKSGDFASLAGIDLGDRVLIPAYDSAGLVLATNFKPSTSYTTSSISSAGNTNVTLTGSDVEANYANTSFTITSLPANGGSLYKADGTLVTLGATISGSPATLTYIAPTVISGNFNDSFTYTFTDSGAGSGTPGTSLTTAPQTVNVKLASALPSGTVVVNGTLGNDNLVASNNGGNLSINLNGTVTNTSIPISSITQLNIYGRNGNDTLELSNLAVKTTLDGGSGTNTLLVDGTTGADTFTLSGANIIYNGATISGNGRLTANGLAGNDTFNVTTANATANVLGGDDNDSLVYTTASSSLSGTFDGGAGTNTIDASATTTANTLSFATNKLTVNSVATPFVNVQSVIGGNNSGNVASGANTGTTYQISAANVVTVGSVTFNNFKTLNGGTGNDTYAIADGVTFTGTINGLGGTNTIDVSARTTASTLNVGSKLISGLSTVWINITNVIGNNSVSGNTVITSGAATAFTVTGANTGTGFASNLYPIAFSGFGNINGGSGADTFKFFDGGSLTGNINGGTGANVLDDSALSTAPTATPYTNTVSGVGGTYLNVQTLIGSTTAGGTLNGSPSSPATFNITGANAGTVGAATFSKFTKLVGGTAGDTFKIANGVTFAGTIDGGGGTNILDLSAYSTAVSVNLVTKTATGLANAYANIKTFNGGTAANTITGLSTSTVYTITGSDAGTVGNTATFTKFGSIVAGAGNDTFKFNDGATLSGSIDGGAGQNTIDDSSYSTSITANTAAGTITGIGGTFANIKVINGGTAGNSLTGPSTGATYTITGANAGTIGTATTFTKFQSITAGSGNDIFAFANGATLSGSIDGGAGQNSLDYSAYTTGVTINLATNTATGVGGTVNNFVNVRGGSGNDTITGNNLGNVIVGGPGNDTINAGNGRNILIGGAGSDTVNGGSDDDIVIGGTTSYDANTVALDAILAEWASSDSYTTRISLIKNGGGLNGTYKLVNGSTVKDDSAADTLLGNAGNDWFFEGTGDTDDHQPGEQIN